MGLNFCCSAGCGQVEAGSLAFSDTLRHWSYIGTAPTIVDASDFYTGAKAFRFNTVGAAARAVINRNHSVAGGGTEGVLRFAFKFPTLPNGDVTIGGWTPVAGAQPALRYRTATQDVVSAVGGTNGTKSFVLSADVWYVVDLRSYVAASPRLCMARIRQWGSASVTDLGTVAFAIASGSTLSDIRVGLGLATETVEADLYVTAIAHSELGDDYPIGPGVGLALFPAADGTHNVDAAGDFKYDNSTNVPTNATDTFSYIDDTLSTAITNYLAVLAGTGEYLEWTLGTPPTAGRFNGMQVTVGIHASAGTPANTMSLRVVDGGNNGELLSDVDTSIASIAFYTVPQHTAPSGGLWTTAKLAASKWRLTSSWTSPAVTAIPFLHSLVVEVDFVVDPPGPTPRGPIRSHPFVWL